MDNILIPENLEFLRKKMPLLTKKEYKRMEEVIIQLYTTEIEAVQRLIERGFTKDYKGIVEKEWMRFIAKMVIALEKIKGLKMGRDKLQILVGFSLFIIIHLLPIGPIEKELLSAIIMEFVPVITDTLIDTSKFLYKNRKNIIKKLLCCLK